MINKCIQIDLHIGDLSLSEQQHSEQQSHNTDAYLQFSAIFFVVFVGADAFISGLKKVTYSGRTDGFLKETPIKRLQIV